MCCGHGRSHATSPGISIMRASTLCNPSLSAASMSYWASQAHAFHQPVCQRLSSLHYWSIPRSYQPNLLSFRMRSRSSLPSCASSSLDLVMTMSCCLTLTDLSDHCHITALQTLEVWLCQWPSLTGIEHCLPHTSAVHAATCPERDVTGIENW